MRRPATLLPAPAARLIGFVLLAGLGALEWRRMVESLSAWRGLLWVVAAAVAVGLLLASERRRNPLAFPAAFAAGVALVVACSGIELRLLLPRSWDELGEGLSRGAEALGGVQLPYQGTDRWPGETLELFGALLVLAAAYVAFWPRPGRRGSPLGALVILLVLVVAPVAAMTTPAPLALGAALAGLTACFLFLERLPVRPGLGAAALAVAALAVALPLGAAADREEPWFDYRSFAEGLGPVDPVSFTWDHAYGPVDWPRDGRELFRVRSDRPLYWKAETLDGFDGRRWRVAGSGDRDGSGPVADLPSDYADRPGWTTRVQITLRRLETDTLVGPGTILDLEDAARGVQAEWIPGRWLASRELGRGDSYTVLAHVPQPLVSDLADANAGLEGRQSDSLELSLSLRENALRGAPQLPRPPGSRRRRYADDVTLEFPAFGEEARPRAHYEVLDQYADGVDALRRSDYWRTWRLARRIAADATSPWDYVQRVNAHLRLRPFRYSERPPEGPAGVTPLEVFLFHTRAGYCQHFSGAMAVLLRMGGVPARVAAGFTPGGLRRRAGEWVVRDFDAHSWVEAWFDGIGWVTLDPTPGATPARSQTAALEVPAYLREADVTGPAPGADEAPPARRPEGLTRETVVPRAAAGDEGGFPWPIVLAALALGVVAAAAMRRRLAAGVPDGDPDLAELERALRRSGRPVSGGMTLSELERRLGGSDYLRALRTGRYGARPTSPTPAQRAEFRRELASGLGWSGRLRALWALPPTIGLRRRPR